MSLQHDSSHSMARVSRRGAWTCGALVVAAVAVLVASCATARPAPGPVSKQEFLYSGGALAVGGTIRRLIDKHPAEPLLVQAATLLPSSGGEGRGEVRDFHYGRVDLPEARFAISIGAGDTSVVGRRVENCRETTVQNTLRDVDVLGRLKAGRVEMGLTTRHCLESGEDASFRLLTAKAEDLTIDGVAIHLRPVEVFSRPLTFAELIGQQISGKGGSLADVVGRAARFDSALPRRGYDKAGHSVFEDRLLLTSVFESLSERELAAIVEANKGREKRPELLAGNGLYLPGFGKIYFGRSTISRNKRETAMFHLELGSPVEGDIDIGVEYGNGLQYP